jgi:glycine C-acetyltransferase
VVGLLRQRARPYLFSNSVMPAIAQATLAALDLLERSDAPRARLRANASRFRRELTQAGFTLAGEGHPIIPVMLGDAGWPAPSPTSCSEGIYVVGFSFPVVPQGQARIRTQMSAAHTPNTSTAPSPPS